MASKVEMTYEGLSLSSKTHSYSWRRISWSLATIFQFPFPSSSTCTGSLGVDSRRSSRRIDLDCAGHVSQNPYLTEEEPQEERHVPGILRTEPLGCMAIPRWSGPRKSLCVPELRATYNTWPRPSSRFVIYTLPLPATSSVHLTNRSARVQQLKTDPDNGTPETVPGRESKSKESKNKSKLPQQATLIAK